MNPSRQLFSLLPIANAGTLATGTDGKGIPRKILTDALCHPHASFIGTPRQTADAIIKGSPPFDGLSVLLFTHEHRDHFHADLVAAFCGENPDIPILLNPKSAGAVRKRLSRSADLRVMDPPRFSGQILDLNGLNISVISLSHMSAEFSDVHNLAFALHFQEGPVVHTGDAEASEENCRALAAFAPPGCTLCAPFPWLTVPHAFARVRTILTPGSLLLLHLPEPEQDRWNWGNAVSRAMARHHKESPKLYLGRTGGPVFAMEKR